MPPTIAVVGIGCENATFSPQFTKLSDFATSATEEDMRAVYEKYGLTTAKQGDKIHLDNAAPHLVKHLPRAFSDFNFRFAARYRTMPGGRIERGAFEAIVEKTEGALAAIKEEEGSIEGVWLDYHGAMNADGHDDAEGILTEVARRIAGPTSLVAASFDLHGNFSAKMASLINICTAYRTAPHVDVQETRLRALHLLTSCIRSGADPKLSYCKIPLVISGEMSNTDDEPSKTLYSATLEHAEKAPEVLDASILIGYCWADEPRSGASVLVTSIDKAAGDRAALGIAAEVWAVRSRFRFGVASGSVAWAVGEAAAREKPCVVSDSGDNPTAGGVGDNAAMTRAFAQLPSPPPHNVLIQGPVDSSTVELCLRHDTGSRLNVTLGAAFDTINGSPFTCEATILHKHPSTTKYTFMYEGVSYPTTMPPTVVLAVSNTVAVIVPSERKPFHYFADFKELGLDLTDYDILVVKLGYLVPDIKAYSKSNIMALSPGAVNAELRSLEYKRVPQPFYPKDLDMTWSPAITV
ncbi:MlrC domain-containing protein [Diplonema papillatum]|nr:MlrC domain-containing protein [Diplonema papillatum]|eukprot:gene2294-3549_t